MIKQKLTAWMPKFDALTQRERGLVAAAVLAGIIMVGNTIFIDLPLASAQSLEKKLQAERIELNMLQGKMLALQQDIRDPDQDRRQRLTDLSKQLTEAKQALAEHERLLVPPSDVPRLLEKLLTRHAGLRLLALSTLPPVVAGQETETEKPNAVSSLASSGKTVEKILPGKESGQIWKHGVEIRLKGGYADLLAYVADLEQLQQRLLWGDVQLKADYPQSELAIRIYTYSLDQSWLKL